MRPIQQTRQLDAADPNGIFVDQNPAAGVALTLDGAFVTAGVATLDTQRVVELESAADMSGITFEVVGTDEQGREITETIVGPNAGTSATLLDFLTVTSITPSGTIGSDVEGGTSGVGASIPIPIDQYLAPTNIGIGVVLISGTIDYTVQHSFDDPFNADLSVIPTWFNSDSTDLENATDSQDGNFAFPPRMVRLLTNSGTGTIVLTLVQAGAVA